MLLCFCNEYDDNDEYNGDDVDGGDDDDDGDDDGDDKVKEMDGRTSRE